jgi:hypothetical protein
LTSDLDLPSISSPEVLSTNLPFAGISSLLGYRVAQGHEYLSGFCFCIDPGYTTKFRRVRSMAT